MGYWDEGYEREERRHIEAGDYRVLIADVEEATSKSSGNKMLVITIQPNGFPDVKIKHYIVKNQYYNRNMTEFKDSFGIADRDFDFFAWKGALGGARLAEDENGYMKVKYFLSPEKCNKLPEWEGTLPTRQSITATPEDDFDDLPF